MTITSRRRAELRAEAHHLSVVAHLGTHGITDTVLETLDDALRTRELIKVQVGKGVELKAKDASVELAHHLSADIIQVIGRTLTLYRENPELKRKEGAPPPWRR
jgi:RNA-binding protein